MRTSDERYRTRARRERLLDTRVHDDELDPDFRTEILSSWRRCQLVGVVPTGEEAPYRPEFERPVRLLRAAGPVIDRLAEQLEDSPVSIVLADTDAQIIDRRAGGRSLVRVLDRARIAPGFVFAEEFTGTNGIGSALEAAKPFTVAGAEHFRENLQDFACIGSPVRHPMTGRVEGVLDVTCRVEEAHGAMKPLVLAAVREIESRMYAETTRRERMLLDRFVRANRRAGTAVVSLNEDVIMANTAASAILDLSDQATLWDWACRMLGSSDECTGEVQLAHDVVAQATAVRIGEKGEMAGVLVEMRPHTRTDGRSPIARRTPHRSRRRADHDGVVGRSVAANRLRSDVDAAVGTGRAVLVCGEPGVGKLHVATYLHRRRTDGEPATVLDAVLAEDDPAGWIARLRTLCSGGGPVVLRHLDRLVPELAERVESIVAAAVPGSVVATARTRGEATPAGRVLDHFPLSVTVPPLRYRVEDIADLAPPLLAAHSSRRPVPKLLPGTLRALGAHDWPGNVRELEAVLAAAVNRSAGSDIALEHLAPEYRSAGRRTGRTSLSRAERDVVLEALAETHGNKLAAAERLGIARSTLYRKMRVLGIDENHLPAPTSR
ncbi:sigma-54-dependent Fis family transcriptional regulator [Pseudonocardia benzenivorans]|uniref:Sigma-54-dependent Fis family transcriptional regulator n=1 Tax=Pseudonocardia benzenivorans TaxID=228005 RepID=A0ABW3VIG9_9PSEU|nr:helix-turn-helix domain-containing protein [Pseudonocardia dioxanivorans]